MRIEIISELSEIESIRLEWDELLSKSDSQTIFLTWDWVYCWWKAYSGQEDTLFIMKFYLGDELVAIAPLYCETRKCLGLFNTRVLRFIGDGSGDSEYLDLVIKNGEEKKVYQHFGEYINSNSKSWDALVLSEIPEMSKFFQFLPEISSGKIIQIKSANCAFMNLPDTWNEYIDILDAKFRKEIERKARNLEKEEGFTVGKDTDVGNVNHFLDIFFELHGNRWSLKGKEGAFSDHRRKAFYYDLIPRLLASDKVDLNKIEIDGNIVAAEVVLKYGKTLFVLQQCMNPDYSNWGIGKILRYYILKNAIECNYKILDHLGGSQKHKLRWGSRIKKSFTVILVNWNLKGLIFILWPILKEGFKDLIRSIIPEKFIKCVKKYAEA